MLRRHVALKLLRREAQADPESLARFQREALAASKIGTPEIVEVVDFASHASGVGRQTYMVMELLEGESLEDWMDRSGRLDAGLERLASLCDGLAAAHRAGVIHRDIKPANVFCRRPDPTELDGQPARVKILDFGIAKITAGGAGFVTRQGSLLGTPYYLAPERALGEALSPAADLYSVGVILYEMLTGAVPFAAATFMAILAHHVHSRPLDPRQAAPDRPIPAGIAELCMRLLAKRPADRPDAGAVAGLLRGMLAAEGPALAAVETGAREVVVDSRLDTQILPQDGGTPGSGKGAETLLLAPTGVDKAATEILTVAAPLERPRGRAWTDVRGVLLGALVALVVAGAVSGTVMLVFRDGGVEPQLVEPELESPPAAGLAPAPVPTPVTMEPEGPDEAETGMEGSNQPAAADSGTKEPPPEIEAVPEPKVEPPAPSKPTGKSKPTQPKPEAPDPIEPEPTAPKEPASPDPGLPTIKDDVYD
ncbi:MAG: protein kinase [Myxococcales bacterium]|nr:protein kinase [Myxococcales bacterium]